MTGIPNQSTNQESVYPKGSMAAKLVAHKERDKKYRKIIEKPMMYLEERYHQIDPAEHQPEVPLPEVLRGWG